MHPGGPPTTVWVHPAVEVRPSVVAGRGLFATASLPLGEVVLRLGGRLVDLRELHRLFEAADAEGSYVDTVAVDDDTHLVLPSGSVAHFGNHSCDPTLWHVGPYELAVRRALKPGGELTIDYAASSDDPTFRMTCTCGAATCRGEVTGADWQRPELQRRYRGHWTPGLQRRIDGHRPTPR